MRIINVVPEMDQLQMGKQGENKSTKFLFDVSDWLEKYPGCTITLVNRRPNENSSYPCVLTTEEDGRRGWVINSADLAIDGKGECELKCTLGDMIEKDKRTWKTKIKKSLSGEGDAPEPWESVMDDIEALVGDAQDAAADAEDAKEAAEEAASIAAHAPIIQNGYWYEWDVTTEQYVNTEVKAQGEDGDPGQDATPALITKNYSELTFPVTAGTMCYHSGLLYKANQAIATSEEWTEAHWTQTTIEAEQSALTTEINSRYTKPNTGIPATDMAETVQTSLGKADSAYQKPQTGIPASDMAEGVIPDISGKADKTVTDDLQKNKAPVIIDSAEGNPIVLTDGADGLPVDGMKIHFLPKQDTSGSDPSPSHVCPISGWTGVTVHRAGKNLIPYPYKTTSGTYNNVTYSINSDGTVNLHGTASQTLFIVLYGNNTTTVSRLATLKDIGFNAGDTITLSSNFSGRLLFQFNKADGTLTSPSAVYSDNGATVTAIIPSDAAYGYICLRVANGVTINQDNVWFMIQKGSTASHYTPYAGQSYPVTFQDGETIYGGTLDAVNGVLTVEWALVDMGTMQWTYHNSGFMYNANLPMKNKGGGLICSIYKHDESGGPKPKLTVNGYIVRVYDDNYTDPDVFKEAVSGQTICYPLATPIEIPLDPITVQTLIGDNTIWSDANGTIELDYRADTKLWISGHSTTVDSALSDTSENPVQNKVIKTALDGKEPKHNATTVSGATPTITGVENTRYICGECSTLTITAPASGCIDVVFESGSTPTVLTVSSAKTGVTAIKWANGFDPTALEANTTYEINILDGELGVVGEWT